MPEIEITYNCKRLHKTMDTTNNCLKCWFTLNGKCNGPEKIDVNGKSPLPEQLGLFEKTGEELV